MGEDEALRLSEKIDEGTLKAPRAAESVRRAHDLPMGMSNALAFSSHGLAIRNGSIANIAGGKSPHPCFSASILRWRATAGGACPWAAKETARAKPIVISRLPTFTFHGPALSARARYLNGRPQDLRAGAASSSNKPKASSEVTILGDEPSDAIAAGSIFNVMLDDEHVSVGRNPNGSEAFCFIGVKGDPGPVFRS